MERALAALEEPSAPPPPSFRDYGELTEFLRANGEILLYGVLQKQTECLRFDEGSLCVKAERAALEAFVPKLRHALKLYTGREWAVETVLAEPVAPVKSEESRRAEERRLLLRRLSESEEMRRIRKCFPEATIESAGE
jgi:hypothetical protein